jgi:hypothetical protein
LDFNRWTSAGTVAAPRPDDCLLPLLPPEQPGPMRHAILLSFTNQVRKVRWNMAKIILLNQGKRWVSVNLFEDTNEPTTDMSTGRWSVKASSSNPGGGAAAENDLSPVNPEYYVWLYYGSTLVLAETLPESSPGGADPTKFKSIVFLTDVKRTSTEQYELSGIGEGRYWGGKVLSPGAITWSLPMKASAAFNGGGRSAPSMAP